MVGLGGSAVEGKAAGRASTDFEQCAGVPAVAAARRVEAHDEHSDGEQGEGGDAGAGDGMARDEALCEDAADYCGADEEDCGLADEVEGLVAGEDVFDPLDFPLRAARGAKGAGLGAARGDPASAIVTEIRGEEEHARLRRWRMDQSTWRRKRRSL